MHPVRVGTAGWSLPAKPDAPGTHLAHYARVLCCTEINSSFYRPHRAATWARWAAETPPDFRFSIKAPRLITHESKLRNPRTPQHLGHLRQHRPTPRLCQRDPSPGTRRAAVMPISVN